MDINEPSVVTDDLAVAMAMAMVMEMICTRMGKEGSSPEEAEMEMGMGMEIANGPGRRKGPWAQGVSALVTAVSASAPSTVIICWHAISLGGSTKD